MIATQTCTQLPSEGLTLLMLRHTFGGSPGPSEWGSIAESICDLANAKENGILYPSNRQLSILYQTRLLSRMASLLELDEISYRHPSQLKRHIQPVHRRFLWPDGGH